MQAKKRLNLCMGSACHQSGGYKLIPTLQALIERHGLADRLDLEGAFCLDRCGAGGALELDGCVVSGLLSANIEDVFRTEILARFEVE